ncbi:hypothetical protein CSA37_01910 [Candidatus Fermentibacteria bacterium]|nr:MAG: hypothetical protein CSA37_01910 [Candidatus Fermentibacteria bacterium]
MKKYSFLLLTVIGPLITAVYAYDTWLYTFNCPEACTDVLVLPPINGNITFASYCYVNGSDSDPFTWLAQVNESGQINWEHTLDIPPRGLVPVSGGGCILLRSVSATSVLTKYNSYGNTVWSINLPQKTDLLYVTPEGDLILSLEDQIQKRDGNGNIIWTTPVPSQMSEIRAFGNSDFQSGSFAIAGTSMYGDFQMGIADESGTVPWTSSFHDPYWNYQDTQGVFADAAGNCYGCATYSIPMPPMDTRSWVQRANNGGSLIWSMEYDCVGGICPAPDGRIAVTGTNDDEKLYFCFLNQNTGAEIYQILHDIPEAVLRPKGILPCSEGGYLIGGAASYDVFLARVDSLGLINGAGIPEQESSLPEITVSANPVSTSAVISVSVPEAGNMNITVFDIFGRKVGTLTDQMVTEGNHSLQWGLTDSDGSPLPNGFYTIRAVTAGGAATFRMVVLR